MFATVAPDNPAAAWFKINNPIKDHDRIKKLVERGISGQNAGRCRYGPVAQE